MKTIKLCITALFAFTALAGFAQQDQKAEKILDELAEKNKSYSTIKADFSIKYKNLQSGNYENTSQGTILMKGDKYKLDLSRSVIYYNGTTLWNYMPEVEEVNISEPVQDPEEQDILNHPNRIFDIYKEDFKYKYLGQNTQNNASYHKIDLYPKDLEKDYSRIRLHISSGDYQIQSAKIFGKDGTRYTLTIENMEVNQPIDDSAFVFSKAEHPNVEVIDMRF